MGDEGDEKGRAEIDRCGRALKLRFGMTVRGIVLARLMGFTSLSSYYVALAAGRIQVPLHQIPRQKGRCAMTVDVARWLVENGKDWKTLIEEAAAASRK